MTSDPHRKASAKEEKDSGQDSCNVKIILQISKIPLGECVCPTSTPFNPAEYGTLTDLNKGDDKRYFVTSRGVIELNTSKYLIWVTNEKKAFAFFEQEVNGGK